MLQGFTKSAPKCVRYYASAKNNQGVSLNENLVAGPKTQKNLSHLNIHIRMRPIVLLCDIKRMFYSIFYDPTGEPRTKLENSRDAFRFLWNKDPSEPPNVYRFRKMLMGSRCSPFQANSVIEHHLDMLIASSTDDEIIEACKLLKKFRYIDDIILSFILPF